MGVKHLLLTAMMSWLLLLKSQSSKCHFFGQPYTFVVIVEKPSLHCNILPPAPFLGCTERRRRGSELFRTMVPQMFLDYNSQKPWPAQRMVKREVDMLTPRHPALREVFPCPKKSFPDIGTEYIFLFKLSAAIFLPNLSFSHCF